MCPLPAPPGDPKKKNPYTPSAGYILPNATLSSRTILYINLHCMRSYFQSLGLNSAETLKIKVNTILSQFKRWVNFDTKANLGLTMGKMCRREDVSWSQKSQLKYLKKESKHRPSCFFFLNPWVNFSFSTQHEMGNLCVSHSWERGKKINHPSCHMHRDSLDIVLYL